MQTRMLAWDDLRYFLAVSRHGTLSAAARALAVAQPTVGRRLSAFERRLGAQLFQRGLGGFILTATGQRLVVLAEQMEDAAIEAERTASGHDDGLRGTVRITTSEWLAGRILGTALAPLLERNPALVIDIVADARHLNLVRREADIAIRPSTFAQQTIYTRRIGRVGFGVYGSPHYLARHGELGGRGEGHTMIALPDDIGDATRAWIEAHAQAARIVIRANGREQMALLAVSGAGLACLPRIVGDATPGLRRLPARIPSRALWLGVHRDVREVPRVRAAIEALAAEVPRIAGLAPPEE
jgi:DNA-binding transcriptional LysR family regulator